MPQAKDGGRESAYRFRASEVKSCVIRCASARVRGITKQGERPCRFRASGAKSRTYSLRDSVWPVPLRAGAETRPYNILSKTIPGFESKVSHCSLRDSLRVGTRKKGPSNDGPVCFLFLFFFVDGDGDAEVGKLKVIDRGGALGHRFGRVLHFRIGNHVTKRLRLQHLHTKPVKP